MNCKYFKGVTDRKSNTCMIICGKDRFYCCSKEFEQERLKLCNGDFTKCRPFLWRELKANGLLPEDGGSTERLLKIYNENLTEVAMNTTDTEQVTQTDDIEMQMSSLELHEQQIINQCRIQAQSFSETGKLLKQIKDGGEYTIKGYANFTDYIVKTCGTIFPFKSSQAYKYIRVYESYGARLEQYGTISLDILDMFKNVNPEDFAELAEEHDMQNMTVKQAEELKQQLDKANEQLSFLQSTVEDKTKETEGQQTEIDRLKAEIEALKNKPVDVVVKDPDEDDIKKRIDAEVKKMASEYKKKIADLKGTVSELKSKAESADNIKEGYEKKLQAINDKLDNEKSAADGRIKELEEQLKTAGKADEELVEFKFYFTETQSSLSKLLNVLNKIEDAEKKAKFKGAALKFIEAIKADLENNNE